MNVLPVFSLQGVRQCHTAGAEQSATTLKSIIEEGIAARFGLEIPSLFCAEHRRCVGGSSPVVGQ